MILPQTVIAKRAVRGLLAGISKTGGGQYDTVFRPVVEDDFSPQADVEVGLRFVGVNAPESEQTGVDEDILVASIDVLCSRKLANDDTDIEDVTLIVLGDIKEILRRDRTLQASAVYLEIGDAEIGNHVDDGYYGCSLSVLFHVRQRQTSDF